MAYCPNCGSEVDSTDRFCRNCGTDISQSSDTTLGDSTSTTESPLEDNREYTSESHESITIESDLTDVDSNLRAYLSDDERIIKQLSIRKSMSGDNDASPFASLSNTEYPGVLTNRRLVFERPKGVKEIGLSHISSVQSEESTEKEGASALCGCCGGIFLLGGLASLTDDPSTALFGLVFGGLMIAVAVWLARSDSLHKFKIITGDEYPESDLTLLTTEDVGPEFSQVLR